MNIGICGGGNLAHAFIAEFGVYADISVSLYTRRPNQWNNTIECLFNNNKHTANINNISDTMDILHGLDIVIITVPTSAHFEFANCIKPYISENTLLIITPTIGASYFIFENFFPNNPIAYLQRVPYIARIAEYGQSIIYSKKNYLDVYFTRCLDYHKKFISSFICSSYTELTNYWFVVFSNSNPVIHTARIYELSQNNYPATNMPLFYKEWGDTASKYSLQMDNDIQNILNFLDINNFKTLKEHYGVLNIEQLTCKINSIDALKDILSPMCIQKDNKYYFDIESRYFTEDLPYGTCFMKYIASLFNIETNALDFIILNIQNFLNTNFISDNIFNFDEWYTFIGFNPMSLYPFKEKISQLLKIKKINSNTSLDILFGGGELDNHTLPVYRECVC